MKGKMQSQKTTRKDTETLPKHQRQADGILFGREIEEFRRKQSSELRFVSAI